MNRSALIISLLMATTFVCHAQDKPSGPFKYFFQPRELTNNLLDPAPKRAKWDFKPTVQIPAIKITESTRDNAKIDASFLASVGGGISLQRTVIRNQKNYATFSWSPVTFLLTGDTSKDNPLDLSYCTTIGFFNNLIQFGVGYDLGTVENRSRVFGVMSIGVNLTNN